VSTLDVQRDHLSLILDCLELLNPHGSLYFSTNLRDFKLDASLTGLSKNTTQHSIPEDFRNKRIHHSFYFEKP
jgi:23S rRNA G2069 N7-methylase RlmK/C1962 C5-methylase RlmI